MTTKNPLTKLNDELKSKYLNIENSIQRYILNCVYSEVNMSLRIKKKFLKDLTGKNHLWKKEIKLINIQVFTFVLNQKKNSPITLYLFSQFKNNTIKKIYISVDKIDIKTESLNRNTKKID
ncbi:hypothetical protein M0811_14368 [Anaeramoeba ignava]|uniref:Uncharacterized protein n=1 Tax=Anaeramoeba ignava TaxID=1746090 RepID=A0A9Q0LTF7_ANAIG|nr:hypothetical protein M0811_14368 [Anaeramoeba ignava]